MPLDCLVHWRDLVRVHRAGLLATVAIGQTWFAHPYLTALGQTEFGHDRI